jgi:flagellar motility protein MotE (MotC chaperone)
MVQDSKLMWMAQVTKEERAIFVESLGELMEATGVRRFEELTQEKLQPTFAILKAYSHMDKEAKANLKKLLELRHRFQEPFTQNTQK